MALRSAATGLVAGMTYLLCLGLYFGAIYASYKYNGLIWAIVTAIPVFSQLLWFGVMWASVGFFNWYTYLFVAVGIFNLAHAALG